MKAQGHLAIKRFTGMLLLAVGLSGNLIAQDARTTGPDKEFIMELYRGANFVRVVVYFVDATRYSYIIVEKGAFKDGQFRQCGYVDLKDQDPNGGAVEAKDNYPLSPYDDSYYRIRTVTLDHIERIYPPLRLPAAGTGAQCTE